jgi:hypothetical protein
MKRTNYLILIAFVLLTACGEQDTKSDTSEKSELPVELKKAEINESARDVRTSVKKAMYDFSSKTKEELNKMLEESNKLFEDTKAGLESAEKKVNESVGDAKIEAENIRDQHKKRVELLSERLEAIKSAIEGDNK